MHPIVRAIVAGGALLSGATSASAVVIGGVEFPEGALSFADAVTLYEPNIVGGQPTEPHRDATNALGIPDYNSVNTCSTGPDCTFVSLGAGGRLVVRFLDNVLTGSDSAADDLYIFEVGPDVEDTTVEISSNGIEWFSVGTVTGSTRGINIDAYGYGSSFSFSYVRLQDVAGLDGQSGATVGADIDAVGAISTRLVPEPATWAMMILGMGAVGAGMRARRKGAVTATC